jgi:hypothetical protein
MDYQPKFLPLVDFLSRVPAIGSSKIFSAADETESWWVKFGIDTDHPLAWHVVQELGHVLNYLSIDEPLPTLFKPVSPPPYMNGGPRDFLSWVIESPHSMPPSVVTQWLEGRMPRPVEDLAQWVESDED